MLSFDTNPQAEDCARNIRKEIRSGQFSGQTSTAAPGFVQGNVVIVPSVFAKDFENYCILNSKACGLIARGKPGDPYLSSLGDIDIRTDVPSYFVFRDGKRVEEKIDILDLWEDDFVAFVLGCSFSFEEALISAGLVPRHIEMKSNAAMYVTNIDTNPSGPFQGKLVVSMRPYTVEQTIEAIQITSAFPKTHGAPIYFGNPQKIGIDSLASPDFGDPVSCRENELPVFWACGVTPQVAIKEAKLPICITHKPGCMLITDIPSTDFKGEA